MYMHLIDGKPAKFDRWEDNGEKCGQICYADNIAMSDMMPSLRAIRREQKLSSDWRKSKGFTTMGYGYMIVYPDL